MVLSEKAKTFKATVHFPKTSNINAIEIKKLNKNWKALIKEKKKKDYKLAEGSIEDGNKFDRTGRFKTDLICSITFSGWRRWT